jgi:hypothetical protein
MSRVPQQLDHCKVMIDRYLVVVVVKGEVELLWRMHLSRNKNPHHPMIDHDVEHFN